VDLKPVTLAAFADELGKIAAAHGLNVISKSRKGSRPISVSKLLQKDREGTLRKRKHADAQGNAQDVRGDACDDPGAAQIPHRKGEVPTKGSDDISVGQKTGMVPGANTQTSAVTSGEDTRMTPSVRPSPGDVPTQANMAVDQPNNRIGPPTRGITFDQAAKKVRSGDVPTRTEDMNKVDRGDMRDNTTTVSGLGQSSTGIGAFNSPSEHT
jgi:hypothetical protein